MQSESLANRPAGRTVWDLVDWREANRIVTNLRQRLFRAARANDHRNHDLGHVVPANVLALGDLLGGVRLEVDPFV